MDDCPFCNKGVPTTRSVMVPLYDPKTHLPTGQSLRMSQAAYQKILAAATSIPLPKV